MYPGFVDYVKEHPVECRAVYCSLGNKEIYTGNRIMAGVGKRTKEIVSDLSRYINVVFREESGGHFSDPSDC